MDSVTRDQSYIDPSGSTPQVIRLSRRGVLRSLGALAALALAGLRLERAGAEDGPGDINLTAIKAYVVDQAALQKTGTASMRAAAEQYYQIAVDSDFDYTAIGETKRDQVVPLLQTIQEVWPDASTRYENIEGLIAGVPSLRYYDVWLDSGPTGADDPAGALDWSLELPDGRILEKPGNLFTHLTEPVIYGTTPAFVGLPFDLDGDGEMELGDVLPEANVLVASMTALDDGTAEMQKAVDGWNPTVEDLFTALTVMIPTVSEYFEQWKLSSFVAGAQSQQASFVRLSRLVDIQGIYGGIDLAYDDVRPVVAAVDPDLDAVIDQGFGELLIYVRDLYDREQGGYRFSPDEASLYGGEAQGKADMLVGQVSQAIALLGLAVGDA